ncbi:hypothetical protein [Nocardioides sp. W7]|uniref:hypothetical protein n=1 Tax=Nocardioides sp. W7 TaxID=2931390 RepID=UPI001FD279CC|nr:hypothetical protein [Nocardioides sp. W7]
MTEASVAAASALLEEAGIGVSAAEARRLGEAYVVLKDRTRQLQALTETELEGECRS